MSDTKRSEESYKQRVVQKARQCGDFVMGDDGYYVFWPTVRNIGALSTVDLRILANELDNLNREWDIIVQSDPRIAGASHK